MPEPGEFTDEHDGFTVQIDQCAWGHVARKPTWLYVVRVPRKIVVSGIRTGGTPTHHIACERQRRRGVLKSCSEHLRRRSPPLFAEWLVELARHATRCLTPSQSGQYWSGPDQSGGQ